VRAGDRSAGRANGSEQLGNAAAKHVGDRSKQEHSWNVMLLLTPAGHNLP
jgi:hypothetical protein